MPKINFEKFLDAMEVVQRSSKSFVVVTLVKQAGSVPQDVGARMIVSQEGLEFGTVGGGKVENKAIEEAQKMIKERTRYHFVDWNLQKDIHMTCGGVVSFFFELFDNRHPFHIAVFGAGHIAQELIPFLLKIDCEISCYDPRPEWMVKLPVSSRLKKVCTQDMAGEVSKLPNHCFVTIMTMGHATDLPVLVEAMRQRSRFSYVGNIGSHQKSLRLKSDLKAAGIEDHLLDQFYCPMGEDFGSNAPVEISLSIIAQLLKTKDQIFGKAHAFIGC